MYTQKTNTSTGLSAVDRCRRLLTHAHHQKNTQIDKHILSLRMLFDCGMITYEQMLGKTKEMEDQRKELLLSVHKYKIRQTTFRDGNRSRPRTRWETRIPDTSQKNGYRWIRSADEEAFFDKLFSAYGLKELVDEKHPHPLSLAGLYDKWIELRLAKVRPGTVKKDQATWLRYYEGDAITWKSLASIKPSEAFLWLSNKVESLHLTRQQYTEMRGLWNGIEGFAYNDDLIPRRIIKQIDPPARGLFTVKKPRYKQEAVFSKEELGKIREASWSLYQRSHFNTAYLGLILDMSLGFRASELVCLRWDCINAEARTITIRQAESPKHELIDGRLVCRGYEILDHLKCGHEQRTVPLTAEAEHMLATLRKENLKHGVLGEYVFVQKSGERVHTRAFHKALKKVYKTLGWTGKLGGLHEFRRTYATALIENHIDDKAVQQWMGHRDWNTTKRYYQYTDQTPDPSAADAVSRAIWG